jgi:hypothetical protein
VWRKTDKEKIMQKLARRNARRRLATECDRLDATSRDT